MSASIKVGDLVKLNPKFYSITITANPLKDIVGIVVLIEKDFYGKGHGPTQDRCHVLFGDQMSYEASSALIKFKSDE